MRSLEGVNSSRRVEFALGESVPFAEADGHGCTAEGDNGLFSEKLRVREGRSRRATRSTDLALGGARDAVRLGIREADRVLVGRQSEEERNQVQA